MYSGEEKDAGMGTDDIDEDNIRLENILKDEELEEGDSDVELHALNERQSSQLSASYYGSRDDDFQSQSRPSTSSDVTASSFPTTSMCNDADDYGFKFDISTANAESCLAINRAYQEILLDQLRQIEVALAENRARQKTVEEESTQDSKSSVPSWKARRQLLFTTPYFKDYTGAAPPPNEDVFVKNSMQESKQLIKPRTGWSKAERQQLTNAVVRDALEQLTRPILSKLEVERAKSQKCKSAEEIAASKLRISNLRDQLAEKQATPRNELMRNVDVKCVDFMKICVVTFKGKYEAQECENMWRNVLQPGINRGKWTDEENQHLDALVVKYNMRNWEKIASELGTQRTPFQCLQHYQMKIAMSKSSEWTPEEDDNLKTAVEFCTLGSGKIQWYQVAYFLENRSPAMCLARWRKSNPDMKRGKWTDVEDCELIKAVDKLGTNDWIRVAEMVSQRQAHQCRERWTNILCPMLRGKQGRYEDDKKLIQLHQLHGDDWFKISKDLPGWTDKDVQRRFKQLLKWKKKTAEFYNLCKSENHTQQQSKSSRKNKNMPDLAYYKQDIASEEDKLIMAKHEEYVQGFAKAHSEMDLSELFQQLEDWKDNEVAVPRLPPLNRHFGSSLTALRSKHLESANLVKMEKVEPTNEKVENLSFFLKTSEKIQEQDVARIRQLIFRKTPLSIKELLAIKSFLAILESKGSEGINLKQKLIQELEQCKDKRKNKKKKKKRDEDGWTSEEEDEEKENGSEEEEQDVEMETNNHEEEETEEFNTSKVEKRVISEELLRKRKAALDDHGNINKRLRQLVERKMDPEDLINMADAKRKQYKMYPDTVLWEHMYKDAAEEKQMKRKSLQLLMKTLDVDKVSAIKKAYDFKRKSAAAALLMTTEKTRHRTRRKSKVKPASNDSNEAVDALLDLNEEVGIEMNERTALNSDKNHQKDGNFSQEDERAEPREDGMTSTSENFCKPLPYLPPNMTNMHGLRRMLLEHRCLYDSAAVHLMDMQGAVRLKTMKTLVQNPESFSLVGARKPTKCTVKTEPDDDGFTSAILKARTTMPYKKLTARMVSMFGWPSFLSSLETEGMKQEAIIPLPPARETLAQQQQDKESEKLKSIVMARRQQLTHDSNISDQEAISQLVDEILNNQKQKKSQKGYVKKMSERMSRGTYERERKKTIRRLGLEKEMEEYERQRKEKADAASSSSQKTSCSGDQSDVQEKLSTSTCEETAAVEVTNLTDVSPSVSDAKPAPRRGRPRGRPPGRKANQEALPGVMVRKSGRPSKQSWKEALLERTPSPKKKKLCKPGQLQQILPAMENIILHLSEPIRDKVISTFTKNQASHLSLLQAKNFKASSTSTNQEERSEEHQGKTNGKPQGSDYQESSANQDPVDSSNPVETSSSNQIQALQSSTSTQSPIAASQEQTPVNEKNKSTTYCLGRSLLQPAFSGCMASLSKTSISDLIKSSSSSVLCTGSSKNKSPESEKDRKRTQPLGEEKRRRGRPRKIVKMGSEAAVGINSIVSAGHKELESLNEARQTSLEPTDKQDQDSVSKWLGRGKALMSKNSAPRKRSVSSKPADTAVNLPNEQAVDSLGKVLEARKATDSEGAVRVLVHKNAVSLISPELQDKLRNKLNATATVRTDSGGDSNHVLKNPETSVSSPTVIIQQVDNKSESTPDKRQPTIEIIMNVSIGKNDTEPERRALPHVHKVVKIVTGNAASSSPAASKGINQKLNAINSSPLSSKAVQITGQANSISALASKEVKITGQANSISPLASKEVQITGQANSISPLASKEVKITGQANSTSPLASKEVKITGVANSISPLASKEVKVTGSIESSSGKAIKVTETDKSSSLVALNEHHLVKTSSCASKDINDTGVTSSLSSFACLQASEAKASRTGFTNDEIQLSSSVIIGETSGNDNLQSSVQSIIVEDTAAKSGSQCTEEIRNNGMPVQNYINLRRVLTDSQMLIPGISGETNPQTDQNSD